MKSSIKPVLALIPARAGSKGVPKKNLQELGGKSLVRIAIECAKQTGLFANIAVSSDGDSILEEAQKWGAEILKRPEPLANDTASVSDTISHALETYREQGTEFKSVVLLEPSCPLRTPEMIKQTLQELDLFDSAFTVSTVDVKFHPAKQFDLDPEGIAKNILSGASPIYRQSLKPTYIRNGAAYALRVERFFKDKSILGPNPKAIIVETPLSNIDTLEDLQLARELWESR